MKLFIATTFLVVNLLTPVTLGFAPTQLSVTSPKNSILSASTEKHATEVSTDDDAWVAFDFNNDNDVDHTEINAGNNNWLVADFENIQEPPKATTSVEKIYDWFHTASLDSVSGNKESLKNVRLASSALDTAGGNEWFSTSTPAVPTGKPLNMNELVSHKPIAMAPTQSQSVGVSQKGGATSWFHSTSPNNLDSQKSVGATIGPTSGINEWFSQALFSPKKQASKIAAGGGSWFTQAIQAGSAPNTAASVTTTGLSQGSSSWLANTVAASPLPAQQTTTETHPQHGPNEWFSVAPAPEARTAPVVVEPSSFRKTHDWFADAVPDASVTGASVYEHDKMPREWFMAAILN